MEAVIGVKISIALWVLLFLACAMMTRFIGESWRFAIKYAAAYVSVLVALGWLARIFYLWVGIDL